MEIGPTATSEVSEGTAPAASGVTVYAEGFGTRARTDRPHSISLFRADRDPARDGAARGLDVLLGIGIGAAVMYYLDPDRGPERRAAARERIAALFAR
jgi:hypothetical protein